MLRRSCAPVLAIPAECERRRSGASGGEHRLRGADRCGGGHRSAPRPPATFLHPSGMARRGGSARRGCALWTAPAERSGDGAFDRAKRCLTPRPRRAQRAELLFPLRVLRGLGVRHYLVGTLLRARKRCRRSALPPQSIWPRVRGSEWKWWPALRARPGRAAARPYRRARVRACGKPFRPPLLPAVSDLRR